MASMTWLDGVLIFLAAFLGGMTNSVAGGGTMLTFPVLLWLGLDPRVANATSTVALWPGSLGGAWGFRSELGRSPLARKRLLHLSLTCIVGGASGAALLLFTPSHTFMRIVPWLIFFATALFMGQESLDHWRGATTAPEGPSRIGWIGITLFQFLIALYGGYFGAGAGILTLAALGMLSIRDIYEANGTKNILIFCTNSLAVVCFISFRIVDWPHALVMAAGAIMGGYGASAVAMRRLGRRPMRLIVIAVGLTIGAVMLWKTWLAPG